MKPEQAEFGNVPEKISHAQKVIKKGLEESRNPAFGFTGGKDSTLTAWLIKQTCEKHDLKKPYAIFIDHGQHFPEVHDFAERILEDWGFEKKEVSASNLTSKQPGETIQYDQLQPMQKREAKKIDDTRTEFPNSLNDAVGNHLLKTVPLKKELKEQKVDLLINGIRWDEHESRSSEWFFSPRSNPSHTRCHPILPFTEEDVWAATWMEIFPDYTGHYEELGGYPESEDDLPGDMDIQDTPINPKYWKGYRSLGSETGTGKNSDKAAWMQDLENTEERGQRAQTKDEEKIMEKLRNLGYP